MLKLIIILYSEKKNKNKNVSKPTFWSSLESMKYENPPKDFPSAKTFLHWFIMHKLKMMKM